MTQRITNMSIHAKIYLLSQQIQRAKHEIETVSGEQLSLFTLALDEVGYLLPDDARELIKEEIDELISVFLAIRLPDPQEDRQVMCV